MREFLELEDLIAKGDRDAIITWMEETLLDLDIQPWSQTAYSRGHSDGFTEGWESAIESVEKE